MKRYVDLDEILLALPKSAAKIIEDWPTANVVDIDEGIKMGAQLAAMHGSDATTQELEKAYFEGIEVGYKKATEHKYGTWELKTFDDGYGEYQLYECNLCGAVTAQRRNFCWDCGADMRRNDGKTSD